MTQNNNDDKEIRWLREHRERKRRRTEAHGSYYLDPQYEEYKKKVDDFLFELWPDIKDVRMIRCIMTDVGIFYGKDKERTYRDLDLLDLELTFLKERRADLDYQIEKLEKIYDQAVLEDRKKGPKMFRKVTTT